MFVDDVSTSAEHRLNQILHTLKHVYEIELDLNETALEDIDALQESSEIVKNSIVSEGAFNSWHSDPTYTKHMLILEATRIYLREIAPKRRQVVKENHHHSHTHDTKAVGRWMMHFAEENRSTDSKVMNMLNAFSRVGDDLCQVGEAFGAKNMKALVKSYEDRAKSDDETDSKTAKDSLSALRIGIRMYDKRHGDKMEEANYKGWVSNPQANLASRFAHDPDRAATVYKANKYDPKTGLGGYIAPRGATLDDPNIQMQLYRNLDSTKSKPLKFKDGSILVINPKMARQALSKIESMRPVDKHEAVKSIMGSKDAFIAFVKQQGVKEGETGPKFTGYWKGKNKVKPGNKMGSSNLEESKDKTLKEDHMQHHDYQASMARAELYRNAKYGVDMLKMIREEDDVEPWIAAALTKSAMYLDKIYHYMDYYTKFEPGEIAEGMEKPDLDMNDDDDSTLGETTGSVARMNLTEIIEYSIKLFHMIQPGDKLEGWVAMKLTTASESISSSKHYLDYKHFEHHAGDHFDLKESRVVSEGPSRKDFRVVAAYIANHPNPSARLYLARFLSDIFEELNPRFDREKFYKASKAEEQPMAQKMKKAQVAESTNPEQDLAQAQTLIAAKSLSDELQSMAEKVARMAVDDLMPLVDSMKTQFGPEAAEGYNNTVKSQLDTLLQTVQSTKEQSDNAVLALQTGGVPSAPTDISNVGGDLPPVGDEMGDMGDMDGMGEPDSDGLGTTPAAAGGDEPLGRAKKPAPGEEELAEAAKKSKSPYAIGMWQAKKAAGMDPDKPAKGLPKKVVKKAHEIGKSIDGTDESIKNTNGLLEKALRGQRILQRELDEHRSEFAMMVVEGQATDPLKTGQGLEGDLIEKKISKVNSMIGQLKSSIATMEAASSKKLQAVIEQEEKAYRFAEIKATTPWGVMTESTNGKRSYKFFEDQKARDYWVQFNKSETLRLINPEHFDIAAKS